MSCQTIAEPRDVCYIFSRLVIFWERLMETSEHNLPKLLGALRGKHVFVTNPGRQVWKGVIDECCCGNTEVKILLDRPLHRTDGKTWKQSRHGVTLTAAVDVNLFYDSLLLHFHCRQGIVRVVMLSMPHEVDCIPTNYYAFIRSEGN